jgi:Tfp pilus assembly protein PilX
MTIVIIVIIVLGLLAAYVTQLGYNQSRLSSTSGARRAKMLYLAKAGVVEASWRIRENYTVGLTPGSFLVDGYDPAAYSIDVNGDGTNDCSINIGPVTNAATKQRQIQATGLDV